MFDISFFGLRLIVSDIVEIVAFFSNFTGLGYKPKVDDDDDKVSQPSSGYEALDDFYASSSSTSSSSAMRRAREDVDDFLSTHDDRAKKLSTGFLSRNSYKDDYFADDWHKPSTSYTSLSSMKSSEMRTFSASSSSSSSAMKSAWNDDNDVSLSSSVKPGFVGLNNQGATCYMNSLLQV